MSLNRSLSDPSRCTNVHVDVQRSSVSSGSTPARDAPSISASFLGKSFTPQHVECVVPTLIMIMGLFLSAQIIWGSLNTTPRVYH